MVVGEAPVEEAEELAELLGELLLGEGVGRAAQGPRRDLVGAGARPIPRSTRPGWRASSIPNCSATTSGAWFGSMTPPEPIRMVEVALATWASRTAGEELAMPGMLWCSATQ